MTGSNWAYEQAIANIESFYPVVAVAELPEVSFKVLGRKFPFLFDIEMTHGYLSLKQRGDT